jgi:hypothetical protein
MRGRARGGVVPRSIAERFLLLRMEKGMEMNGFSEWWKLGLSRVREKGVSHSGEVPRISADGRVLHAADWGVREGFLGKGEGRCVLTCDDRSLKRSDENTKVIEILSLFEFHFFKCTGLSSLFKPGGYLRHSFREEYWGLVGLQGIFFFYELWVVRWRRLAIKCSSKFKFGGCLGCRDVTTEVPC